MNKKAFFQLHLAVFIFGFTAILGHLISSSHFTLVWHRMWIAAVSFLFIPGFFRALRNFPVKQLPLFAGLGILVSLHWITFYGSIKIGGSPSLTLACFGLTSTFTSFLEPFIFKRRILLYEVLLGLLALLGIVFVAYGNGDEAELSKGYFPAIIIGIISTFLAALFSTINSKHVRYTDPRMMTFLELSSGFLFLTLVYFLSRSLHLDHYALNAGSLEFLPKGEHPVYQVFHSEWANIIWIFILALVCTTLAFVLNLRAMQHISAFTANLAINLEPVYGILLAAFIFKEYTYLNSNFYIGSFLILTGVFIHPFIKRKLRLS